jgi:membrane fusion protein, copper/silver efflux system
VDLLAFWRRNQRFSDGQSGDGGLKEQLIKERALRLSSRARARKSNHTLHMKTNRTWLWLLLPLPIAAAGAYLLWQSSSARASDAPGRKVLYYQDSMHPWIKSDQPGKCTICNMDLTPISEGDKGFAAGRDLVVLNSNAITVLHVQTEAVQRRPLSRTLRVAGTLEANDGRKAVLSAPARGRIEEMAVEYAGVEVEKGQSVINFFSPDLTALRRVLLVGNPVNVSSNAPSTADRYTAGLIAPISGVVVERNVYSGQYVAEGDRLLAIADASMLWFRFDVYESQLPWFKLGQNLEVTVSAVPGKVYPATISFIEPTLNDATRTVKIRADIGNPAVPDSQPPRRPLRFGMYAEGRVRAETPDVLTVPRTAILFPGNAAYAYVDNGDGAYERHRVKLGRQGDTVWEVLDGLAEGDRVVICGNVLLDAQAQFAQSGNEPEPAPGEPEPAADDPKPPLASSPAASLAAGHCATASHADVAVPKQMAALRGHGVAAVLVMNQPQPQTATNSAPDSAFKNIVAQAAELSRALAADDLAQFNQHAARLSALLADLHQRPDPRDLLFPDELRSPGELNGGGRIVMARHGAPMEEELVKRLSVISEGEPAKNLTEARARFLPFSTVMVELAQQLKKSDPAFSGLKIYYCPMAPKPGLWLQSKGPLANPYFGSAMLKCGKEVL